LENVILEDLYYTDIDKFPLYLNYSTLIADAKTYLEGEKCKSDKIIISNMRLISDLEEWKDEKFQM
jgi:hypothetical protein